MSNPNHFILTPHFFPCTQYLTKLLDDPLLWLDVAQPFQKQSYQNRAYISGANKLLKLSIPLQSGKSQKPLKEAKIAYADQWVRKTWTAIASAYGKTPYFPFYAGRVEALLKQRYSFLVDLNHATLELMATVFSLNFDSHWMPDEASLPNGVTDLRSVIHPKHSWQQDPYFEPYPYLQAFEERFGFMPNLSGLDLLFNQGPEGKAILKASQAYSSV